MRLYRLYIAKPLLIFYLFIFAAFILGSIVGIIIGILRRFAPDGPPVWIFVIVLGVAIGNAYYWLRFPFEIKQKDDNSLEFRAVFRRTTISPSEIVSIRAKRYSFGFVDIVHHEGTLHVLNQIDGFHELVFWIKSISPTVVIKGF